MKFTLTAARAFLGNDIDVQVENDGGTIASVVTVLDGSEIGRDDLSPPSVSYERSFPHAGNASPELEHTLVVTATDSQGNSQSSTKIWKDNH